MLASALKQTLLEPAKQIEARKLVNAETKALHAALHDPQRFPRSHEPTDRNDEVRSIVKQAHEYLTAVDPLVHAAVVGGAYGGSDHRRMWTRSVETAARPAFEVVGGSQGLLDLRRLAPLPILYAGALAAMENENWESFRAFVADPQVESEGGTGPFIGAAHPGLVFQHAEIAASVFARELAGDDVPDEALDQYRSRGGLKRTAMSDALHAALRPHFDYEFPTDASYDAAFDRLEILLALVAEDAHLVQISEVLPTGPYMYGAWTGRFAWRDRYAQVALEEIFIRGARAAGDRWGPLRVGVFGGDSARLEAAYETFSEAAGKARQRAHF